jgi:ABC-type bacteriocin/lantibiotic exporter with double-glycine peptidase domain
MRLTSLGLFILLLGAMPSCAGARDNCATASTYAFCRLMGIPVSEATLRQALNQTKETSFAEIQDFLKRAHCPALILQCKESDVYALPVPLIAYITLHSGREQITHYTTVARSDPKRGVEVIDPMLSRDAPVWISPGEFSRVFNRYVLVGAK